MSTIVRRRRASRMTLGPTSDTNCLEDGSCIPF